MPKEILNSSDIVKTVITEVGDIQVTIFSRGEIAVKDEVGSSVIFELEEGLSVASIMLDLIMEHMLAHMPKRN